MKDFFKILAKILSYSAGVALIGGAYLFVDSIKNKPLSKEEVKEIVKQEIIPVVKQVEDVSGQVKDFVFLYNLDKVDATALANRLIAGIAVLDSSVERHYRKANLNDELMRLIMDQRGRKYDTSQYSPVIKYEKVK